MAAAADMAPSRLEVWGGVECSVVRVGSDIRDQLRETGHQNRPDDLDRIAGLGIQTLRYPVLWERCTRGHPSACGWGWHDRRLRALRRLGMRAIVGLVHHGSGPLPQGLLDPDFATGLAAHAAQVAARYPDLEWWTPVNEPLTTARFSFLYGHWYPHMHDESAFLRAVVNQCRGVLLAMRAIRRQTPSARLVQTEDLGRAFGTRPLRLQAGATKMSGAGSRSTCCAASWTGRHPWRERLEAIGVPPSDLDELATGEATPDIIGINHYATSDRFLDHRTALYPPHLRGGNGRQAYADTEAVRADGLREAELGWEPRLREAWERYRVPLAITEAHLGCDEPEEQLRWLMESWRAAKVLQEEGAEVRAVTAWALLGLNDWSTMLRERRDDYEPGAFDAREHPVRATELAAAIASLARNGDFSHPALQSPGWWRRQDRARSVLRRTG